MDSSTTDTMNLALKLKKKVMAIFKQFTTYVLIVISLKMEYFVTICSHMHNALVQHTRCTGRCTKQNKKPCSFYMCKSQPI